jgi:hypothetical protein
MKKLMQLKNNRFAIKALNVNQWNLEVLILFHFLILFYPFHALCISNTDSTNGTWNLQIRTDYGFIIAHRPALEPLQEEHVKGFEITISRQGFGKNDWENNFNFPSYGITVAAFDLGSKDKLGSGIALYPFINFPLGKKTGQGLYFRYGMGLGYVEKIFNRTDNFKNAAIGSHFNEAVHFDLHYEKRISERSDLELGAGITHFSNGAFNLPNLGINIATINLAYRLAFGDKRPFIHREIQKVNKNSSILIHAGGFSKSIYPPLGKHYFAAVISSMYFKPISHKSAWGLGLDLFYDNSISARIDKLGLRKSKSIDDFRPGVYGAYHLSIHKIGLMFNMGYYLYNGWKDDGNIYHKICVNYYFKKIFLCLNLKSHYARADMIELGVGYRITKK